MEVPLSPDVQSKLARLAAERGRDAEALAREAIERFVNYDEWFVHEVEKGLGQIARGEVLTHEAVGARLEKSLTEKQSRRQKLELRWTEEAAADLEHITDCLFENAPQRAAELVRGIYNAPAALLTFPYRVRVGMKMDKRR
jgi:predicted transcriptional regulator